MCIEGFLEELGLRLILWSKEQESVMEIFTIFAHEERVLELGENKRKPMREGGKTKSNLN